MTQRSPTEMALVPSDRPHVFLVAKRLSNERVLVTAFLRNVPDGDGFDYCHDYCREHQLVYSYSWRCTEVYAQAPVEAGDL